MTLRSWGSSLRHAWMLALSLGACARTRAEAPPSPAAADPLVIIDHRALMARKPDLDTPNVKIWNMQQTPTIRINLVEMHGELRQHKHPDASHSLLLLEGQVRATVGDKVVEMKNKGDFVSIPAGVLHKYNTVGPSALLISADGPYYDPRKTVFVPEAAAH